MLYGFGWRWDGPVNSSLHSPKSSNLPPADNAGEGKATGSHKPAHAPRDGRDGLGSDSAAAAAIAAAGKVKVVGGRGAGGGGDGPVQNATGNVTTTTATTAHANNANNSTMTDEGVKVRQARSVHHTPLACFSANLARVVYVRTWQVERPARFLTRLRWCVATTH